MDPNSPNREPQISNDEKDVNAGTPVKWYANRISYDGTFGLFDSRNGSFVGFAQRGEDARRIVASVNALAKLPIEDIEDIERLKPEDVQFVLAGLLGDKQVAPAAPTTNTK